MLSYSTSALIKLPSYCQNLEFLALVTWQQVHSLISLRKLWVTSQTLHPYFYTVYDIIPFLQKSLRSCWPLAGWRFCLLMWWSHICGITEHMAIFLQWRQFWIKWFLKTTQLGFVLTGPHYSRQKSTEQPVQVRGMLSQLTALYYWFSLFRDD